MHHTCHWYIIRNNTITKKSPNHVHKLGAKFLYKRWLVNSTQLHPLYELSIVSKPQQVQNKHNIHSFFNCSTTAIWSYCVIVMMYCTLWYFDHKTKHGDTTPRPRQQRRNLVQWTYLHITFFIKGVIESVTEAGRSYINTQEESPIRTDFFPLHSWWIFSQSNTEIQQWVSQATTTLFYPKHWYNFSSNDNTELLVNKNICRE